jgi:hypothetical protein
VCVCGGGGLLVTGGGGAEGRGLGGCGAIHHRVKTDNFIHQKPDKAPSLTRLKSKEILTLMSDCLSSLRVGWGSADVGRAVQHYMATLMPQNCYDVSM